MNMLKYKQDTTSPYSHRAIYPTIFTRYNGVNFKLGIDHRKSFWFRAIFTDLPRLLIIHGPQELLRVMYPISPGSKTLIYLTKEPHPSLGSQHEP